MRRKNSPEKTTYVKGVKGRVPKDNAYTKVYITNHIIEVVTIENPMISRMEKGIKRVDKKHYFNTSTGEVKEFISSEEVTTKEMNRKYRHLKRVINTNFEGKMSEIHITLTYFSNMVEREKISDDFKGFRRKFSKKYKNCAYIVIYEPTGKGVWHMHILMKRTDGKDLFIPQQELSEMWGKGYAYVTRIRGNDDIGAYFCGFSSEEGKETNKKAQRRKYYKKGYRLFSRSRTGIDNPTELQLTHKEAMELVLGVKPCINKVSGIFALETDELLNVIYRQEFNLKRAGISDGEK